MDPATAQLRSGLAGLTVLATADLDALWHQVDDAEKARDALRDVLPSLVDVYGTAAAALAADWYDELRDTHGARGRFTAIPAEITDPGTDELAGWGVSPLFQKEPDWASARVLVAGGLQRRIANLARVTVTGSSIADPSAAGWKWGGVGRCDYCRGAIHSGQVHTVPDFHSHDHCHCAAVPAFH